MSKYQKLITKILSGKNDANIRFDEVISLLKAIGFIERNNGSHHIFYMDGVEEIINIQSVASNTKPYQVKQIRNLILKYNLEVNENE